MKHLLESLNGRLQLHSTDSAIKQLVNEVRDSKDSKSSETFYDTLEKVLIELRTTDHAVAFLKPVRRGEAPEYDRYIKHPMDLSTMLKKVKAHSYKNKRDFLDDLNLIWENCLIYNSDPTHPLRRSALFMRKKADHIMERITDKNERPQQVNIRILKPPPAQHYSKSRTIESSDEESASETPSGMVNGKTKARHINGSATNGAGTSANGLMHAAGVTVNGLTNGNASSSHEAKTTVLGKRRPGREEIPFGDRRAIIRTPQSMATFRDLDIDMQRYLDSEGAGPSRLPPGFVTRHDIGERVHKKLKSVVSDKESEFGLFGPCSGHDELPQGPAYHGEALMRDGLPTVEDDQQVLGAWWHAMADDNLRGAGLPPMVQPSELVPSKAKRKGLARRPPKSKRPIRTSGMESVMVKNINTLRIMRKVHSQLSVIHAGGDPRPRTPPPEGELLPPVKKPDKRSFAIPVDGGEKVAKSRLKSRATTVLEHAGFEGTSKAALDVLTDVTADFMMNLGRTIQFYRDKYCRTMNAEEIILHTLFESGIIEVQELERYIKDDVERYGTKVADLEKKLSAAYREQVESVIIEDDMLFDPDGDAFIAGGFTEDLGEDFFGFRAMGLDKELGVPILSVPSRLFHGRTKRPDASTAEGAKSNEPPPPYPPPPTFIPLNQINVESQPGLLQGYYRERFEKLAGPVAPGLPLPGPPPPANGRPLPPYPLLPNNTPILYGPPSGLPGATLPPSAQPLTVADDVPSPLKSKMGPLGQISSTAAGAKSKPPKPPGPGKGNGKKAKAAAAAAAANSGENGDGPGSGSGSKGGPPASGKPGEGASSHGAGGTGAGSTNVSGAASQGGGGMLPTSTSTAAPKKKSSKPSKKKSASVAPGPNGTPQIGTIVMASA